MALVTQTITPDRHYTPFEGMSEQQRLYNSTPRGIVRFEAEVASTVKPINDDYQLNITGSLQPNFAHVLSSLSFQLQIDTSSGFENAVRFRIRNGIPNGVVGNEQLSIFELDSFILKNVSDEQRILNYRLGSLREWYPQPLYPPPGGNPNFTLDASNGADPAMAAGTISFHCAFYQYDLTQVVRYPLNWPAPVGIR